MSFSCQMVRARFAGYAAETLGAEERRAVRAHLAGCRSCFEEAAACDATLLFARAGSEEAPAEEIARVLSAVRTGIALKTAEQRLRPRTSRRLFAALAAAAAVVILLVALPGSLSNRQRPAPQAAGPRLEKAAAGETLWPVAGSEGSEMRKPESGVPAETTVYDWNPGGEQPRVVWIVDRSLDI
ncbi:MAG: anti-sigma factor [Thermoanaerobaculia bacterium]